MTTIAPGQPISPTDTIKDHRTLFGHPVGLFVLFFTEMWERFSYYGMRALLILYMTKYLLEKEMNNPFVLGFQPLRAGLEAVFGHLAIQPLSSQLYGLYTGFVYLTPVAGGWIADRLLGQRKTVVLGAVLMAIGHFLMAMESMFLVALLFLILGNGCFKPNVSTQVGSLYPAGDPRRDGAYTIFYMGINLGAFFSPLVCGTLGQIYGWHYGFGAAGIGMVIGLFVYLWGQKYLAEDNFTIKKDAHEAVNQPLTQSEWRAITGLGVLCFLNIIFWIVYEQQGNTIQIFADQNTDWHIFGWEMPSSWFQAFNSAFIFMFAPVLTALWAWQARRKQEPTSVSKMAIGCALLGISFVALAYIVYGMADSTRISFLWLAFCTLIYTLGELYLSPIGLSLVTKVAPARLVGLMMGVWFLSSFFGNLLSGYVGMLYSSMTKTNFFLLLAALSAGAAFAIFAVNRPMKRAIGADV